MPLTVASTYGNSAAYLKGTGPVPFLNGISNLIAPGNNLNSTNVIRSYGAFNNSSFLLKAFVALIGKSPRLVPFSTTTARGLGNLAVSTAVWPYGN